MREATYTDSCGRKWLVLLPDGAPDSDARMGVPVGPPPLEALGLPEEIEVRLHNQLFDRGLIRRRDLRRRMQDVVGALQAALRVSANRIAALYAEGSENK